MALKTEDKKKVLIIDYQYGVHKMFAGRGYSVLMDDVKSEPDLVVFTGGWDLNPKLYGEEPIRETNFKRERDEVDLKAFHRFPTVPKVGICRGGQFLNVMSGGSLWQHVNNHGRNHVIRNLLKVDEVNFGTVMATSTHHQMMIPSPKGEVLAIATKHDDPKQGLASEYKSAVGKKRPTFDTEVVWYENTNSLCYQPHPEYNGFESNTNYFFTLIDYLFWNRK